MSEVDPTVQEVVLAAIKSGDHVTLARLCATSSRATSILLTFRTSQGDTILSHAAAHGHLDIVKLLMKMGAEPNKLNDYHWTPLCLSAFYGHNHVLRFLLENTAPNLDVGTVFGISPLMCAIYGGQFQTVKSLVLAGANVNGCATTAHSLGMTPLMVACHTRSVQTVKLLLQYGAEHGTQSKLNGWTAFMYAVASSGGWDSQQQLGPPSEGNNNPPPQSLQTQQQDPYHENLVLVDLLLEHGVDPALKNWAGKTAFDIAMEMGRKNIAEALMPSMQPWKDQKLSKSDLKKAKAKMGHRSTSWMKSEVLEVTDIGSADADVRASASLAHNQNSSRNSPPQQSKLHSSDAPSSPEKHVRKKAESGDV
ncbi:hypothetical protein HK102_004660 [Quaeritorhiza haematococci]|nr:hypothetical protein HK102_004660 [Quaeritorhiza haematococci]